MYFDTSRYAPTTITASTPDPHDPPSATALMGLASTAGQPFHVYAFKKKADSSANAATQLYQFINPDKFQIIHCGINGTVFARLRCADGMPQFLQAAQIGRLA